MIKSFGFANFQSFYEWTEVELTIPKKAGHRRLTSELRDSSLISNGVAVIGPNGAGKTTILKAPSFTYWFMFHSFLTAAPESQIPIVPHFAHKSEPSKFELILEHEGITWRYTLVCTQDKVISESLHKKVKKFALLFERTWDENQETYNFKLNNFDFPLKQARRVRQNASLLSTAIQFNVTEAIEITENFKSLFSNVNLLGKSHLLDDRQFDLAAEFYSTNEKARLSMVELLRESDLGLSGVDLKLFATENPNQILRSKWEISGLHDSHGESYTLPFGLESDGTKVLFNFLASALPILENGGFLIFDELETDLHPAMVKKLLDLFADPDINIGKAQIIFSTHSHEILNSLQREQIYLVEKDAEVESHAYSLSSLKGVREFENYYAKYMSGAYGAFPIMGRK